ncbi:hypothetical protein HY522_07770 [bacterium]|nr:hypothetical protein [bacterium]
MIPAEGDRPEIGAALQSYSDRVFSRVPLRERHKRLLRYEFETHLEDFAEELLDLDYKPYAAEAEIVRRVGAPEEIADQFNRTESLRSWLRDHLCTRAVGVVALGYGALSVAIEIFILVLGLSGIDPQIAYDLDAHMVTTRQILALLSGPLAFWLYYRWSGNTHRLTPFATLSIGLFIVVNIVGCNLNFISPFPNPECRIFFLLVDLPSPFSLTPFVDRSFIVYEIELSAISAEYLQDRLHVLSIPYSSWGPGTLLGYCTGLMVGASFLLEWIKQHRSFQPA